MTQYNGKVGNVFKPTAKAILSSTFATPIVVETAVAHLLTDGDVTVISNHATNTAANGTWIITYLTATTFSLVGSVGNGVGGATGTSRGQNLLPTYEEPDDGDAAAVADFNTGLSAVGDRSAYFMLRMGSFKIIKYMFAGPDDNVEPAAELVGWSQTTYAAGAFTVLSFSDVPLIPTDVVIFRSMLSVTWPANTDRSYVKAQRSINSGSAVSDLSAIPRVQYDNSGGATASLTLAHHFGFSETIGANAVSDGYTVAIIGRNHGTGGLVSVRKNSFFELMALRAI